MKTNHHHGASQKIFANARSLRQTSTKAEQFLWRIVRNRNMCGLKFRRQHPLKYFVADFYCHELLLVIELDGGIHNLEYVKKRDEQREKIIAELGITVLRFTNEEVFIQPDKIEKAVKDQINNIKNMTRTN